MNLSYTARINTGGNFCGHDPMRPQFVLAKPAKKGKNGIPRTITLLMERIPQYYFNPRLVPSLNMANKSDRKQRSERREACVVVLAALLKNTDLVSLRVGQPTKDGFLNYTIPLLAKHTHLTLVRVRRAIKDLKAANIITVSQQRILQEDGTWKGLAAVKAVSKHLFDVFGLTVMFEIERKKAVKRLKQKVKDWNSGQDQTFSYKKAGNLSLIISGLKTSPISKKRRKNRQDKPTSSPPNNRESTDTLLANIKENIKNRS